VPEITNFGPMFVSLNLKELKVKVKRAPIFLVCGEKNGDVIAISCDQSG
jgi:hypothetical protein